jgi:hypothetical protein
LGDKFGVITRELERIRTSGALDHTLKAGQSAPEFMLPDAFGN